MYELGNKKTGTKANTSIIAVAAVLLLAVFAASAFAQTTADEWVEKADGYFDKGDYASAITAYNEAIKRDSNSLDAYFYRSYSLFKIKNYDAAISDSNIVIESAPNFATTYMIRGDAYGAKGLYYKAVADYRTALEKGYDPSDYTVNKTNKADMWFCGAIYMEIAVNRFLGNSDAVAEYEKLLKTVSDKNKVTRQEIEAFYRDNVRSLISATVDEQFNKYIFYMDDTYDATLTRNPQSGKYTLSYFMPSSKDDVKEISDLTLDALLAAMGKAGLNKNCENEVSRQAGLLPAVRYAELKRQGYADAPELIAETLANFFINPSTDTYRALAGIYMRIYTNGGSEFGSFHYQASGVYINILNEIFKPLRDKLWDDRRTAIIDASWSRYPADQRFTVFEKQ